VSETSADRAASVQQLMQAMAGEEPGVKEAALKAMAAPIPAPGRETTDIVWLILVSGLVVLLVLALLGLTHVIGDKVDDDKVVTILTTVLAGLLGLFVKSPIQTG
jgi:hypothetical protein